MRDKNFEEDASKNEKTKEKKVQALNVKFQNTVSEKYVRSTYIDKPKMDNYKKEVFGDKSTTKNFYNNDVLHLKNNPAKNKYKGNASKHQSQTDHTVPVKEVYDFASNLPNIADADVKAAVNRKHNYKVIDRKTNAAKKERTNREYVQANPKLSLEQKSKMLIEGVKEDVLVKGELAVKSVGKSFSDVKSYEPIVKTTIAVELGQYINGEKTFAEASVDVVKNSVKAKVDSVIIEQGIGIAKNGVKQMEKQMLKTVGKEGGKKLLGQSVSKGLQVVSGHVGEIVTIAVYMGDAVIKFAKGDITCEEMFIQLGETGTNLVCSTAGAAVGGTMGSTIGGIVGSLILPGVGTAVGILVGDFLGNVIGGAIGYIVGSKICQNLREMMNAPEEVKEYEKYAQMYREYAKQVEQSRIELERYLKYIHKEQQANILEGFRKMSEAIEKNCAQEIADSIDYICHQFDIETEFKTLEEFESKISDSNYVFKIGENT